MRFCMHMFCRFGEADAIADIQRSPTATLFALFPARIWVQIQGRILPLGVDPVEGQHSAHCMRYKTTYTIH